MIEKIKHFVSVLYRTKFCMPFAANNVQFCQDLSQILTTDVTLRCYPDLVALGFWLRPAHLKQLQKNFEMSSDIRLARGLAFHITPGNVDTMFAYSWLISLLAGNKNIVRLSAKGGEAHQRLLTIINKLLVSSQYEQIRHNNLLINYQYNDKITAYLSSISDVRVIWGGDETIKKIRQFPISSTSKDIVFADRFSFSLFNAEHFISEQASKNMEISKLCHLFYRDIFTFGQQACSSPRLLVWYGAEKNIVQAKRLFWNEFKKLLESLDYNNASALANKLVHSQLMAINGCAVNTDQSPALYRITVKEINTELWKQHCGEGLLYEAEVSCLSEMNNYMHKNFQTCSYFGFSKDELKKEVQKGNMHYVLRFVPVGQALAFDTNWDGMNLLNEFSRITTF